MNYSILTADRNTHLKVVTLALIASTVIAIIGWHARPDNNSGNVARSASNGSVVKAGKAIQITTRGDSEVR